MEPLYRVQLRTTRPRTHLRKPTTFFESDEDQLEHILNRAQENFLKQDAKIGRSSDDDIHKGLIDLKRCLDVAELSTQRFTSANDASKTFRRMLDMELKRENKRDDFATVYQAITSTLVLVRHVDGAGREGTDTEVQNYFTELNNVTKEFGTLVDLYYDNAELELKAQGEAKDDKSWGQASLSRTVNFFYGPEYQKKLRELADATSRIETDLRQRLQVNVQTRVWGLPDVPKPANMQEVEAQAMVRKLGGFDVVLADDGKVAQVARVFGEQVTPEMKVLLRKNFGELLNAHSQHFTDMIHGATESLRNEIKGGQAEIMKKLNAGPHNLIEDAEFRKLWQDNGWKTSVKRKLFVDAICGHFRNTFASHDSDKGTVPLRDDNWTLEVLSQIMFHPAIGDAIDDDGSGYVSVWEFNRFLRQKPKEWTVPELFAFWALGWQHLTYDVSLDIRSLILSIKHTLASSAVTSNVRAYLTALDAMESIIAWPQVIEFDEKSLEAVDYSKIQRLTDDYLANTNENFELSVDGKGNIDANSWRWRNLTESYYGQRVELWFFHVLFQVLCRHQHRINLGDESAWPDMIFTLRMLVYEFHSRMKTLLRGWRVQRLDARLHVNSFFNGVFAAWFEVYDKGSKKDFITKLERWGYHPTFDKWDDEDDNKSLDPETEISKLQKLVVHLQQSIERLEGMGKSVEQLESTVKLLLAQQDAKLSVRRLYEVTIDGYEYKV
ncbi:hypothetical protein WG66_005569 [Moniliophthora roreri]|nr:hypothetical protein WG66_005569 [Moniliophthora roreri]